MGPGMSQIPSSIPPETDSVCPRAKGVDASKARKTSGTDAEGPDRTIFGPKKASLVRVDEDAL